MSRLLIEESLRLDLSHPAIRRVVGADALRCGTFEWGRGGDVAARVGFTWRPRTRVLELRFAAGDVAIAQRIQLARAQVRFGGFRLWFECPCTAARTRALFFPPGRSCWAGRAAYRLAYASQQTRPSRLTRFIGALARGEAAERRNHVRRLRRRERLREAHRS